MKKLAVIGLGTAGVQSLSHFLFYLNNEWEVVSISDPSIPIFGIGESTNPSFVNAISFGTNFCMYDELIGGSLNSTVKYGTMYEKWRNIDFINPLIGSNAALHIDTFKLKEWAIEKFSKKWGSKFKIIEGTVKDVKTINDKAIVKVDDLSYEFDYVMDCSGRPKDYSDYNVLTSTTNSCLVHNIKTGSNFLHTKHVATQDGWMFVIPLKTRTSYGYLYNSEITNKDAAKENFSKEIKVPVNELDDIEYSFKSYFSKKVIDGRVIKNGNNALFLEPMFANSLWLYDSINKLLMDKINQKENLDINDIFYKNVKAVSDMIHYMYHGGSLYKTPFWEWIVDKSKDVLGNSEAFEIAKKSSNYHAQIGGEDPTHWVFEAKNLLAIDNGMGYNNFNNSQGI
jgi:tryptophan halogenase